MRKPVDILIQKYQRNLFVAAFNVCGNAEDAQDVVQDTFVKYMCNWSDISGTYIDIYYENVQPVYGDGLCFRLISPNGEEYHSTGGSGTVYQEDGTYTDRIILNKTSLDDTLIIEAYNCYDKTVYGRIEMSRK